MAFALANSDLDVEMSMNALNRASLLKKLALLVAITGISSSISIPVLAQTNPRPSIFNEPPYNRSYPRPGHRPKHGPRHHGHGPGRMLGQGPADNGPPAGGSVDNGPPAGSPPGRGPGG